MDTLGLMDNRRDGALKLVCDSCSPCLVMAGQIPEASLVAGLGMLLVFSCNKEAGEAPCP